MTESPSEQTIGRYALLERIGSGGMGDVFRARDTERGRTVALKLLPEEVAGDAARRNAFLDDARAATRLSHPAIATLYEAAEQDGRLFAAFEFVQGETLRSAMAGGPMPTRRAVPIVIQIADALAEAHAAGIVHRDLRPETIIVTPKGAAKVLEFGLARWTRGGAAREQAATRGTAPAELASAVGYMSPEQVLAQPLDARADVFSLGVILYEMLTGRNPFAAADPGDTLVNILRVKPDPPSRSSPDVPPEVDALVLRMLARDMEVRPDGAASVAAALRESFGERTEQVFEADLETVRPERPGRSRRGLLGAVALLLLIVAAAGVAYPNRDFLRGWWRHQFGPPPSPVIVVLPFADESGQSGAFAEALRADLIARLGQTPGLRLPGRGVPDVLPGQPAADIARRSGAAVALAGAVRRDAGELKIQLEMIDASDGFRFWRREFVNPEGSIYAAETLMTEEVSRALDVPVEPGELRERSFSRVVAPEAYEIYARGREAMRASRYEESVKLFDRAVSLDGGLAEACASLAEALYLTARTRPERFTPAVQARIREAAARATAIEPDLATVRLAGALGAADFRQSVSQFVAAAAADPMRGETYRYLADRIAYVDRAAAERLAARAERLRGAGTDAAVQPGDSPRPRLAAVRKLIAEGRGGEARDALGKLAADQSSCEARAIGAGLLADEKKRDEAQAVAQPLMNGRLPTCGAIAAAALGDGPAAAAALRRVASDPELLRMWIQPADAVAMQSGIDQRWYPWPKVLDHPDVSAAVAELRKVYAEMKKIAGEELKKLPQ